MIHRAHHLQDERLFDSYMAERNGEPVDPPIVEHLADCESCGTRYAELTAFMDRRLRRRNSPGSETNSSAATGQPSWWCPRL